MQKFLIKAYIVKLKEQLDYGVIGRKKFRRYLVEYIFSLRKCFIDREHQYEFLTEERINEILKTVLGSHELIDIDRAIPNSNRRE